MVVRYFVFARWIVISLALVVPGTCAMSYALNVPLTGAPLGRDDRGRSYPSRSSHGGKAIVAWVARTCYKSLMDLPAGLVTESAMRAALDEELGKPSLLLPPSPVVPALQARRDEVAHWASAQVGGSFNPAPQEIVAVSKSRHGIRPVAVWDLPSRLLYRALTAKLTEDMEFPEHSSDAWRSFQRRPLETLPRRGYIVSADIASCYEFIDHALLAQELLAQIGDHKLVSALMMLLRETSGRTYGLPQQCSASDLLADIFLDKLERALLRRELSVTRYNDDLRLICSSWSEVVRAIEILAEEARNHGLILNDSKLLTWSKSAYVEHLDEADNLREQIVKEAGLNIESFYFEEYDDQFDFPDDETDVQNAAAFLILDKWADIAGDGRVDDDDRAEHRALLQLLPSAFNMLGVSGDDADDPLPIVMKMLRFEQMMTPYISRFLMRYENEDRILSQFDKLLEEEAYLTGWQTWWLQQPLSRIPSFSSGDKGEARSEWVHNAYHNAERSPMLRAQAAMTLARHNQIGEDDLLRVYDRSSPVTRPVVVAAIALRKPSKPVERAVTGDSQLNRMVFEWAKVHA